MTKPTDKGWLDVIQGPVETPRTGVGRVHRSWDDTPEGDWKICNKCGRVKAASEYYVRRDGQKLSCCKECHKARMEHLRQQKTKGSGHD